MYKIQVLLSPRDKSNIKVGENLPIPDTVLDYSRDKAINKTASKVSICILKVTEYYNKIKKALGGK